MKPGSWILVVFTLWQRELVRFYRDKSRVIGAIAPPFIFWFLIGSGLGDSFRPSGPLQVNYLQYFFPGTLVLIVLFTAIFSTISIIEDRREGFLQSVLVAPISRTSLVLGKVLGGGSLAFLQGLLFFFLAPSVGLSLTGLGVFYALTALGLTALGLTGLGFILAWRLDSTQGFHAIMNLFLIPMWMLSGALFPVSGAPAWIRALVAINPLSYALSALQQSLLYGGAPISIGPSPILCLAVLGVFCLLMLVASSVTAKSISPRL